ncbi:MAG: HI1506-related protein [Azonexus sp.]
MAEAKKPKAAPALDPSMVLGAAVTKLSIQSRQAGFRRGGRAWPAEAVIVDCAEFTDEQLAQIKAEPMLIVEAVVEPVEA